VLISWRLQGHSNKSIKERLLQLVISADNRAELRYADVVPAGGQGPIRWKNTIVISRGLGVQFNQTKNGHFPALKRCCFKRAIPRPLLLLTRSCAARGDFAHCLRIDLPMVTGAAPLPAYKLVLCFRDMKDRELWRQALLWAEKRLGIVKQHDEYTLADQRAAELEQQEKDRRDAAHHALLLQQLAEAQKTAEESRKRQEELLAAKEQLLAEQDVVKRAAAEDRLRLLQERDEFERNAAEERQRLMKEREEFEAFEARQRAEQARLLSKQEALQQSLKPLKTFMEKDGVGGFVAAALNK
jgi:flagellar biosynthesis GTPase FlhF